MGQSLFFLVLRSDRSEEVAGSPHLRSRLCRTEVDGFSKEKSSFKSLTSLLCNFFVI
jgi:hypothetical protein